MKPTIALDVDGVLADYSKGWQGIGAIGEPIPGAVEFTKQLSEFARITIFTTRCKEFLGTTTAPPGATVPDRLPAVELREIVHQWLQKHGFAYDEIYIGQGKPFFHAVIDDRAVSCRPHDFKKPLAYEIALAEAQQLCQGSKQAEISPALQQELQGKP